MDTQNRMQREIKFRAWHTVKGEMYSWEYIKNTYTIHALSNENVVQLKFMQFTGLKDKNGMEIYEGDVVEHGSRDELDFGVGTVEWNREWACFELKCAYDWGDTHTSNEVITASREWRVIGNIYEHPGLLK